MLDDFWGRTFTVLQVANETGFSTTSAAKTIRALVETGLAVRVSLRPVTPTYTLIEPDAEPPAE
jgi:predicted transcriptional regulator